MDNRITRFHCSPDTNIKILKITKNKNNDYNFRKELPIISSKKSKSLKVLLIVKWSFSKLQTKNVSLIHF